MPRTNYLCFLKSTGSVGRSVDNGEMDPDVNGVPEFKTLSIGVKRAATTPVVSGLAAHTERMQLLGNDAARAAMPRVSELVRSTIADSMPSPVNTLMRGAYQLHFDKIVPDVTRFSTMATAPGPQTYKPSLPAEEWMGSVAKAKLSMSQGLLDAQGSIAKVLLAQQSMF